MASIAEMVEEEAALAEAELADEPEPDEPEPDEPEPETEPEAQAFATIGPEEIRKAETARNTYRKKIGAILGDEAVAHECLLCAGLGYLPDLPPPGTQFGIVLGEDGPALVAAEPMVEPPYREALDKATCDECDGWGNVLTGSRAEHSRVGPCGRCQGAGWVIIARDQSQPPGPLLMPALPPGPDYAAADGLGPDAWGRPHGHQHWGVPPASIPG